MKRSKMIMTGLCALCLVAAGFPMPTMSYADEPTNPVDDNVTIKKEDAASSVPFKEWPTNINLWSKQESINKCLLYESVYPEDGVGFKDSSLPYDNYEPISAAKLTVRAEILRHHYDTVMDVVFPDTAAGEKDLTVVANREMSVAELLAPSKKTGPSVDLLKNQGISITVKTGDVPSLTQACDIRNKISELAKREGLSLYSDTDPRLGVINVHMGEKHADLVKKIVESHDSWLTMKLSPGEGGLQFATRDDDYVPWYGGNKIWHPDGYYCTNSFRINRTATLTAAHCVPARYESSLGSYMGDAMSSLIDYGVDAMYLGGSAYGDRIWVGPAVGTTQSLPASGVYSQSGLIENDSSLLISGATSGQGTVQYQGLGPNDGCLDVQGVHVCFIMRTWAPAGTCLSGDSGGPVGVWDAAHGNVIPTGIVTALMSPDPKKYAHDCFVTRADTIAYIYGNATLG